MSNLGQIHFSIEQVTKLLAMQDQLNSYIHPEWKSQNFDWNFAIIDECREIKEHLGWKWWKENYQCGLTDANRKQVQLEVIDILHFVLSSCAEYDTPAFSVTEWLNGGHNLHPSDIDETVRWILEETITEGTDLCECWASLAIMSGLTTEQVIETYTQKFVLNKFRQDHGYRTGEYCKEWKFNRPIANEDLPVYLEDNEALAEILEGRPVEYLSDEESIYAALKNMYNSRLNK